MNHTPEETKPANTWRIKAFRMAQSWKEKDKYTGSVEFENGTSDSFNLTLTDTHTRMFMEILAPKISESANELMEKLLASIKE